MAMGFFVACVAVSAMSADPTIPTTLTKDFYAGVGVRGDAAAVGSDQGGEAGLLQQFHLLQDPAGGAGVVRRRPGGDEQCSGGQLAGDGRLGSAVQLRGAAACEDGADGPSTCLRRRSGSACAARTRRPCSTTGTRWRA